MLELIRVVTPLRTMSSFVDARAKEERAIDQGEQQIGATPAHRSQSKHEIRREISGRPEYPQHRTQIDQYINADGQGTSVLGTSSMAQAGAGHYRQGSSRPRRRW